MFAMPADVNSKLLYLGRGGGEVEQEEDKPTEFSDRSVMNSSNNNNNYNITTALYNTLILTAVQLTR